MARKPVQPSPMPDHVALRQAQRDAVQMRLAAVVMAVAMLLWMGLQYLGGRLGWQPHFAFLIDLAAMAALVWSLAVTWRVWQRRRTA